MNIEGQAALATGGASGLGEAFPPRLGKPEEFAQLACHLGTNGHLDHEVIRLDGALRMAPR